MQASPPSSQAIEANKPIIPTKQPSKAFQLAWKSLTAFAALVYGVIEALDEGDITTVPFAELLLPTTGTEMLNFEHTSPKSVVKAAQAIASAPIRT